MLGLVSNDDETAYRDTVGALVEWSRVNNLSLNIGKTKELVGDFRRQKGDLLPQTISGGEVDTTFKFLETTISSSLQWESNTTVLLGKAHQFFFFIRKLKKFGVTRDCMVCFYRAIVESVLMFSICAWYGGTMAYERAARESGACCLQNLWL